MNRLKESNVFSGGGVIPLNNRRTLLKSYIWNYVVSNSGKVTLENSIKGDIDLELIGGTEQPTTTGKNLFDPKQLQGISGFTIEGNEITQSGYNVSTGKTLKQLCPEITPGTYILSANNGDFTGLFGITKPMYKKSAIEIVDEDLNRIVSLVGNPNKTIKYTLQIEKGNTVTPYEPYTGGKPSPSPEYPQEIKNSGKWNEEKQKYEVEVEISGNFFDITKVRDTKKLKNNKDGSLTITNSPTEGLATLKEICPDLKVDESYVMRLESTGLSYISIYGIVWDTGQSKTITQTMLDSTVFFYGKDGSTVVIKNIRITRNTGKNMEYTPYRKPQLLTLTSDRPITKWDKLVEQGGQYGWLYKHRIVNDLSALVKDSEPIYGKDGEKYFSVSLQGALFNYDYNKIYSVAGLCPKDSKIHYVPKPMIQSVVIYVSDTDTIMTAKEHMHYKVIYETTESQFVPLSESEQTQLRNLHSYNGTTNITVDSGEVPCGVKVAYKQKK